jgi:aspartyl/asparaginyl beta-hydroxylase (cupin superfamily)
MFYYSDTYPILKEFEKNSFAIWQEYQEISKAIYLRKWPETEKFTGSWEVFGLYHAGRKMKSCCQRAPKTTEVIESVAAKLGTEVLMAGFSRMSPGTEIHPHVDDVTIEKRIHFGVQVPMFGDCGFEVQGQQVEWQEGKAFLFNPKLIHRAWNKTFEDRVVLLADFKKVENST